MKLVNMSAYAFCKNGVKLDYHLRAWLEQHSSIFKEVCIFVIRTGDGSLDVVRDVAGNKNNIKYMWIDEDDEVDDHTPGWYRLYKKKAYDMCTSRVRILLDVDELMHENQVDVLNDARDVLMKHDDIVCPLVYVKFAGNYKTQYHSGFVQQWRIIRDDCFYGFSKDGGNVSVKDMNPRFSWVSLFKKLPEVYHYNGVRDPRALAYKWHVQGKRGRENAPPSKTIDEVTPHKFKKIKERDGRKVTKRGIDFHPRYVREHPEEYFKMVIDEGDDIEDI